MVIANPAGAYGQAGVENNHRIIFEFEASAAVAADDVVMFDTLTGTDELLSVKKATTTAVPAQIAGVAVEAAAAGEVVKVCVFGPAIVNIGTNTVTAGQIAQPSTATEAIAVGATVNATHTHTENTAAAYTQNATTAATATEGFGTFVSANDVPSTDRAVVFVRG